MKKLLCMLVLLASLRAYTGAQTLNDIDTTSGFGRQMLQLYQRYEALRFSGYIQPQFQMAETRGARSFNGGDFGAQADNRFMLRRGRVRLDYVHTNAKGQPLVFFVFQFDCTERGVVTRDFWGRIFENRFELFSLTTGLFARPFGYELLLSSSDRESPERGRMSQLLMRTERDLGAMLTFWPRRPEHPLHAFQLDVGVFNGQGLTGPAEFDSHKDLIARLAFRPPADPDKWRLTGGAQIFRGGFRQYGRTLHRMEGARFAVDSSPANVGRIAPRRYFGADLQLKIPNRRGSTELRAELIAGTQTATQGSSETPGVTPLDGQGGFAPLYIRPFHGAYFYWLQHLGDVRHQLVVKYDWYDPNSAVAGRALNDSFSLADVKFSTLGFGYVFYANRHLKLTGWFDWVRNESTGIPGLAADLPDNVLTFRAQYRF